MADQGGIDFMLPVARWLGYGGETNFQGASLETITWGWRFDGPYEKIKRIWHSTRSIDPPGAGRQAVSHGRSDW